MVIHSYFTIIFFLGFKIAYRLNAMTATLWLSHLPFHLSCTGTYLFASFACAFAFAFTFAFAIMETHMLFLFLSLLKSHAAYWV